jgi:acyl carrier protein
MTDAQLQEKILDIVARETGSEHLRIDPEKDFRQQVHLDSMQFVGIAARIEDEFGIELPIDAVCANTLSEVASLVRRLQLADVRASA